jgi:LuxR family maltose regulon positive regulatory protein
VSEAELALLAMDRGQWTAAAEHVELALAAIDAQRMHDYPTSVLAFAGAARLAAQRGDLPEANRQLTQAMRARPTLTFVLPGMALRARLQMAKVYWAISDQTSARHLLREIDEILLHRPDLGVFVDEVAQFREVIAASERGTISGGPPLTPAELRLLPYMQTHLTFREIGERLFVSRNTVSSEVSSIYRKLGVSSRHDAVRQATLIGLLGATVVGLLGGWVFNALRPKPPVQAAPQAVRSAMNSRASARNRAREFRLDRPCPYGLAFRR